MNKKSNYVWNEKQVCGGCGEVYQGDCCSNTKMSDRAVAWISQALQTLLDRGCSFKYANEEAFRLLEQYGIDNDPEEVALILH